MLISKVRVNVDPFEKKKKVNFFSKKNKLRWIVHQNWKVNFLDQPSLHSYDAT